MHLSTCEEVVTNLRTSDVLPGCEFRHWDTQILPGNATDSIYSLMTAILTIGALMVF